MKSRFDMIYESFMNDFPDYFSIEDDFMNSKYASVFEAKLQSELDKVKPKHRLLKKVTLDFSEDEDADENGDWRVMWVSDDNSNIIHVNLQPLADWIYQNGGEMDDECIEDAYANYYVYDAEGHHLIQHECAHVIDQKSNKGREGYGSHDAVYESIRKDLEKIEPHLDDI